MSELYCKFQIPASNTVGGLAETTIVLQSMTNGQMKVRTEKGRLVQVSYLNLMFNILFIFYCGGAF